MGVGSFGGANIALMGAAVAMNRPRGGGYSSDSSKPPEEDKFKRLTVTIWRALMVVILCLCLGYCGTSNYNKDKPVTVTVMAKELMHKGGKHPHTEPTIGVKTDDNILFDAHLSLAFYNDIKVGDRLILDRSEAFLHPNKIKNRLDLFFVLFGFLSVIGFLVGEIAFGLCGIEEEKNE